MPTVTSIDRLASFAVPRRELEQGEGRARFGIDCAVVGQAPLQHLVGIDVDLVDAIRIDALGGETFKHLLDELDVCGRVIFDAANLEEARVIFWPGPDNSDGSVIHGMILRVGVDGPSLPNISTESREAA